MPEASTTPSLPASVREALTDNRLAELRMAAKALAHHDAANGHLMLELLAEVDRLSADAAKWKAWASHQEWCRWCAEAHPRECSDGALLWAKCHPEDEGAARIIDERGTPPEDTTP